MCHRGSSAMLLALGLASLVVLLVRVLLGAPLQLSRLGSALAALHLCTQEGSQAHNLITANSLAEALMQLSHQPALAYLQLV